MEKNALRNGTKAIINIFAQQGMQINMKKKTTNTDFKKFIKNIDKNFKVKFSDEVILLEGDILIPVKFWKQIKMDLK